MEFTFEASLKPEERFMSKNADTPTIIDEIDATLDRIFEILEKEIAKNDPTN